MNNNSKVSEKHHINTKKDYTNPQTFTLLELFSKPCVEHKCVYVLLK